MKNLVGNALAVVGALSLFSCGAAVGGDADASASALSAGAHRSVERPSVLASAAASTALTCSASHGTLYLNGDPTDYVHPGTDIVTDGTWISTWSTADDVQLYFTPTNSAQGLWWTVELSSRELGKNLAVGGYPNAQRAPFAAKGHAGIDISGDGRGCNTDAGSFHIYAIAFDAKGLKKLSANFTQHCEGGPAALRGMIDFQR